VRRFHVHLLFLLAFALTPILFACGDDKPSTPTAVASSPAASTVAAAQPTLPAGTLTVFAASSLTDAFKEIGTAFEAAHPGVKVEFQFGGSPTLRTQLEQGAKADVLAVADEANMQAALDKGLVATTGKVFVSNKLTIIVPKSNPGKVATPADLAKPGLKLVLAQKDVPVGKYARDSVTKMAADASFRTGFAEKVAANIVSEEANVKAVVAKVQLGEADAGVVYATDVTAGVVNDITQIAIPDTYNVIASYPIAALKASTHTTSAVAFVDFVVSASGQAILKKYGFQSPP
jgi:molybdate transport system substrate-binding protein